MADKLLQCNPGNYQCGNACIPDSKSCIGEGTKNSNFDDFQKLVAQASGAVKAATTGETGEVLQRAAKATAVRAAKTGVSMVLGDNLLSSIVGDVAEEVITSGSVKELGKQALAQLGRIGEAMERVTQNDLEEVNLVELAKSDEFREFATGIVLPNLLEAGAVAATGGGGLAGMVAIKMATGAISGAVDKAISNPELLKEEFAELKKLAGGGSSAHIKKYLMTLTNKELGKYVRETMVTVGVPPLVAQTLTPGLTGIIRHSIQKGVKKVT